MIKQTCICGHKYEFTEDDDKWANYNTFCPKCHKSLALQDRLKKEKEENK